MAKQKLPNGEEIKAWLDRIRRDREWLANELNSSKLTVDSWFSKRGFPAAKLAAIAQLMDDEDAEQTSLIRVPFSDDLLEKAHQAAAIVSTEFQDFCSRAIQHRAEEIIAGSTRPTGKVYQMPAISGRVAEPDIIKADEPHGRDEI